MVMHDEKYIVFKRDEFGNLLEWLAENHPTNAVAYLRDARHTKPLEDAVVIRTQDVFAASGLSAYAHTIRAHCALLRDQYSEGAPPNVAAMVERLERIAAYFHDCAVEAEDRFNRGDVKVPD